MNDPQRPFALQPRRFPLPTLPFRTDLNGFGVGAKVRLEATPYNSSPSGFEVCLSEGTNDIALFARVSFDSEGRSAIEVKSRFDGKWSPPVRHIAIGVVIDRPFLFDITVDSSEFVLRVDGFKVTSFIKRSDDVRTVMLSGALVVNEIVLTPSLMYYTPPPDYQELDPAFNVNFALQKLAILPTAPEVTPSNSIFQKQPLDGPSLVPTEDDSVVLGASTSRRGDSESSLTSIHHLAPPRPPPPVSRKHSVASISSKDRSIPRDIPQFQAPTPAPRSNLKAPAPYNNSHLQRSYSQTSYLYPKLPTDNDEQSRSSPRAAPRQTPVANVPSGTAHHSNNADIWSGLMTEGRRRERRPEGGARGVQMQNPDVTGRSSRQPRSSPPTDSRPYRPRNEPPANAMHSPVQRARSRSIDFGVSAEPKLRMRRNAEPRRRQARPLTTLTTVGIYTPLFSTKQLQEKTESACRATKNFFKLNFRSSLPKQTYRHSKQLIRVSLTEGQLLTMIAIPVPDFNKFDVGLMRGDDYAMLFSARHTEKCVVLNSTRGGVWQKEERVHRFPFMDNESFTLNVRISNPIQVHVNGNFFCQFNLRSGLPLDAIKLDNNLRLEQFRTGQ